MLNMGPLMGPRCHHGVPLADADECRECLQLEAVKIVVLANIAGMLDAMTDFDDTATRAMFLTAAGRYTSMKLHDPQDAAKVFDEIAGVIHHQLPCAPDERMLARAMLLTELSFVAHTPEPQKVFRLHQGGKR